MESPHRIYFDTCALNRPLDDQSQARSRLEAEAVVHLLRAVEEGHCEWVSSDVVVFEVMQTPDAIRREALPGLARRAEFAISLSDQIGRRARVLRDQGLHDLDALHLASAKAAGAEVLRDREQWLAGLTIERVEEEIRQMKLRGEI